MRTLGRHLARHEDKTRAPRYKTRGGEFLQHVDVLDFLETIGIEKIGRSSGDELNFACPFPGHTTGDNRPSAYMNDGSKDRKKCTVWKCHGCGRAGNAVTFLAEHERMSKHEAALHIRQTWAPNFRAPKGGSISAEFELRLAEKWEEDNKIDTETIIEWEHYDKLFYVDWDHALELYEDRARDPAIRYMFKRGFTASTLTRWRVGYDPRSERFTIPICNADGDCVGVKGRAWSKEQRNKYLILGDKENKRPYYGFMPYEKSRYLFGIDKIIGTKIVIVEGELDVIALSQVGIIAVCTGSASVSDEQLLLLRQCADELTIYFDDDEAGNNGVWGYEDKHEEWHPGLVERLEPFVRLRVVDGAPNDPAKFVQDERVPDLLALIAEAESHHRKFLA